MKRGFTLKRSANQGFTLIEIIIAMSLVVAMAGVGIASFRNGSNIQGVETGKERLRQAFLQAKANALAGKKDTTACAGNNTLSGWRVAVDTGTRAFTVQGLCSNNATFSTHTENLPTQITSLNVAPAGNTSILFNALGLGTDKAGNTLFTLTGGTTSRTVTVTASGDVQ